MNEPKVSAKTPLFIPTPNQLTDTGDARHCWMPNPGCLNLQVRHTDSTPRKTAASWASFCGQQQQHELAQK